MTNGIPATLIKGWYSHKQGQFRHRIRTAPENSHVVTLCGQVWLSESAQGVGVAQLNVYSPCRRCLRSLPRWEPK